MANKSVARVLGLLPARGGSKGIAGKNLKPLHGRPLLGWAAAALAEATTVDYRMCCSDSEAILEVARRFGLQTPWLRPPHLAEDKSLVIDVILHALDTLQEREGLAFTHVALVQATSPTVLAQDIDAAVNLALESRADTVIAGYEAGQRHPSAMFTLDDEHKAHWILPADVRMARRQDLPAVFVRTGLIYVISVEMLRRTGSIYGETISAVIIPEERAITIDTMTDFRIAQVLLEESING